MTWDRNTAPTLADGWEYKPADPSHVDCLVGMMEIGDMPLLIVDDDRPCHREIVRAGDKSRLDLMDFIQIRLRYVLHNHPIPGFDYPANAPPSYRQYVFAEVFVVSPSPFLNNPKPLDRSQRICSFGINPPLCNWQADFAGRLNEILSMRELDEAFQTAHNWRLRNAIDAGKRALKLH